MKAQQPEKIDTRPLTNSKVEFHGAGSPGMAQEVLGEKTIHQATDKEQIAYLLEVTRVNSEKYQKQIKELQEKVYELETFNKHLVQSKLKFADEVKEAINKYKA